MAPALISKLKTMIKTLVSNSALGLSSDNIYYRLKAGKNGLLAMVEDATADTLTLHFRQKDNTQDGSETVVLQCESGKTALAAADVARVISGLPKNSQIGKVSEGGSSIEGVNGVQIPAFTIASTALALDAAVGPTLGTATVGCTFSVTITKTADTAVTSTATGVIDAASDVLAVFPGADLVTAGFAASDACTITVVLTNPNQPSSSSTVTSGSLTLTAS